MPLLSRALHFWSRPELFKIRITIEIERPSVEAFDCQPLFKIRITIENERPSVEAFHCQPLFKIRITIENERPSIEAFDCQPQFKIHFVMCKVGQNRMHVLCMTVCM
jgi:hypothetical protein